MLPVDGEAGGEMGTAVRVLVVVVIAGVFGERSRRHLA